MTDATFGGAVPALIGGYLIYLGFGRVEIDDENVKVRWFRARCVYRHDVDRVSTRSHGFPVLILRDESELAVPPIGPISSFFIPSSHGAKDAGALLARALGVPFEE
jgi:hypothetical protein